MTFPNSELVVSRIERWTGRIIVFCVLGTCLSFAGLAYLQVQVAGKASKGDVARDRQTLVFPVSQKVYVDAYVRGVITAADLACFRDSSKCPLAKP